MKISDVLKKEQIVFNLDTNTKEETIKKLSSIFVENGIVDNEEEYVKSVLEREEHSTQVLVMVLLFLMEKVMLSKNLL